MVGGALVLQLFEAQRSFIGRLAVAARNIGAGCQAKRVAVVPVHGVVNLGHLLDDGRGDLAEAGDPGLGRLSKCGAHRIGVRS